MSLNINKIKGYVGFAKRAKKIKFGVDDILKLKSFGVILISSDLAESSLNKVKTYADKKNVMSFILSSTDMIEITENQNIKAFAVTDKNLADAIKKCMTKNSLGGNLE